ncbi:unnamed protein product [Clonostachys rosea f. rosea IK726]|uniref:Uncharacterized protein n=1 Tax=Clonostachys rosea f. rosea IK726 TaxID=1349383 RepID=A0ACA9UDJ7_BIOOC|nr:unnamed protein product [Clonostachys rosea f. rosea IK726]
MDAALDYHEKNPGISLRRVAKLFGVARATLQDHVKTPRKRKEDKNCGRLLTAVKEKALCNYIDRLDSINMAVRGEFVCDAANAIIRARHRPDDITPIHIVKPRWATRFFQRHGYSSRPQKMLDLVRKEAENIEVIQDYFQQLQEVINREGILPDDTWNMDETGFRIGMKSNAMIITKRKRAHYFALPENRESATAVEAISASGRVRRKAFKESTIKAAFKKSGIYPLDCSIIIKDILNRQPLNTPSPAHEPSSSEITTPTTYRQLNKSANKIEKVIFSDPSFSPSKAQLLGRFVRGALFSAATGVQMQRDLSRTKYATAVRSQKRNAKNYRLQSGGILKVSEARNMIIKRKGDEIAKAQAVLDRYAKKLHNTVKKGYFETAKKAREWRRIGILDPLEILEIGRAKRFLIKG